MNNSTIPNLTRKCACCGEEIDVSSENIYNIIYFEKKTYHEECFHQCINKFIQSSSLNKRTRWQHALDTIEQIKQESYEHFTCMICKHEVYKHICSNYNVNVIDSRIWQKLSDIYSGAYNGMVSGQGIPPEHLLDMWKQKMNYLNKIEAKNQSKGINKTVSQRISYDLAILVNKYNDYIQWLNKQKVIEAENSISESETVINMSNFNHKKDISYDNSLDDLVEDIFD